ncbi:MAG: EF-hand domain-containing protein [Gillisia sp.]
MKRNTQIKKFRLIAGIFLLVMGFTGCSNDDDLKEVLEVTAGLPTGYIWIDEWKSLTGNILTVPSVKVGQQSWLAAVPKGEEISNNFIAQPVLVEEGTTSNVQLTFDESVVDYTRQFAEVVLKLYADNPNEGIWGEWDEFDKPIVLANNVLVIKTLTIIVDLTDYVPFRHYFDRNEDGTLDLEEFSETYPNYFQDIWDADGDGYLDKEEFYNTHFINADYDWNNEISLGEWNEGHLRMFANWTDKEFSVYDEDKNGKLSKEEWNKIFEASEWFETYDADSNNLVTQIELHNGFFNDWDLNNDGKIDEEEYNKYYPYVSNWHYGYWDY